MTENFVHLCAKSTPNNGHLLQNEETLQGSLIGGCNFSLHKRNWSYLAQHLPHPCQTPWALWKSPVTVSVPRNESGPCNDRRMNKSLLGVACAGAGEAALCTGRCLVVLDRHSKQSLS